MEECSEYEITVENDEMEEYHEDDILLGDHVEEHGCCESCGQPWCELNQSCIWIIWDEECKEYEITEENDEMEEYHEDDILLGGDRDEHGCCGPCGQSWCEINQRCIFPWKEKCEKDKIISTEDKSCEKLLEVKLEEESINNLTGNLINISKENLKEEEELANENTALEHKLELDHEKEEVLKNNIFMKKEKLKKNTEKKRKNF